MTKLKFITDYVKDAIGKHNITKQYNTSNTFPPIFVTATMM
jgi:hypothetical protein